MKLSIITVIVAMATCTLAKDEKKPPPVKNCDMIQTYKNDCIQYKGTGAWFGGLCRDSKYNHAGSIRACCRNEICTTTKSFGNKNCPDQCKH
ncbi:hypothetical protein NX059_005084 [Plenodomus lindquistii]|nr:hypothetical protein NX059_005084 [Plenodomus lindquistii]